MVDAVSLERAPWRKDYARKLMSAEQAVGGIRSGDSVYIQVVTSRADVHYVVTEYGIAQLYGRTLKERAHALIAISHPDFRAGLESDMKSLPWLA